MLVQLGEKKLCLCVCSFHSVSLVLLPEFISRGGVISARCVLTFFPMFGLKGVGILREKKRKDQRRWLFLFSFVSGVCMCDVWCTTQLGKKLFCFCFVFLFSNFSNWIFILPGLHWIRTQIPEPVKTRPLSLNKNPINQLPSNPSVLDDSLWSLASKGTGMWRSRLAYISQIGLFVFDFVLIYFPRRCVETNRVHEKLTRAE